MTKISKISFSFVICCMFASLIFVWVHAQDEEEDLDAFFADLLDEDTSSGSNTGVIPNTATPSRWFKNTDASQQITVTANAFTFTIPVVNHNNSKITKYVIQYSTTPISSASPAQISKVTKTLPTPLTDRVEFVLGGLTPNTTYHANVIPMDWNIPGAVLNGFSFKTLASQAWWLHGVADLNLANVSYTYEGNEYTVSWTPVDGAEKVQIYLKPAGVWDYIKQTDALMSAGIYKFTASKKWDYLVKLIPVDASNNPTGSELVQTIKVNAVSTPDAPEEVVTNVPKVWPGLNLIVWLLLFGMLIYMLYRSRAVNK